MVFHQFRKSRKCKLYYFFLILNTNVIHFDYYFVNYKSNFYYHLIKLFYLLKNNLQKFLLSFNKLFINIFDNG